MKSNWKFFIEMVSYSRTLFTNMHMQLHNITWNDILGYFKTYSLHITAAGATVVLLWVIMQLHNITWNDILGYFKTYSLHITAAGATVVLLWVIMQLHNITWNDALGYFKTYSLHITAAVAAVVLLWVIMQLYNITWNDVLARISKYSSLITAGATIALVWVTVKYVRLTNEIVNKKIKEIESRQIIEVSNYIWRDLEKLEKLTSSLEEGHSIHGGDVPKLDLDRSYLLEKVKERCPDIEKLIRTYTEETNKLVVFQDRLKL